MRRFAEFFRRERLYVLLLIFVTLFTAFIFTAPDSPRQGAKETASMTDVRVARDAAAERSAVEKILSENKPLALIFGLVTLLVMTLFILGLLIDAVLLASGLFRKRAAPADARPRVCWGVWDVAKVVILTVFFSYMLLLTEASLARVLPVFKDDNFRMIFNTSVIDILVVALILYFTVGQYKERPASLGLSAKGFFGNIFKGVVGYIAFIPVLVAVIAVIAVIVNVLKYVPPKQPVVDLFLKEKNTQLLLYTSLFAAVAGPVIEEVFFRGFLYNAVKKYAGVFWSALITAVVFALLHAHLVGFIPILFLGVFLAYLYERTGSLVPSMTVHIIHNVSMVFLVFLVKQLGVY